MPGLWVLISFLTLTPRVGLKAQERMLPIPVEKMTEAQQKALAEYKADRPGGPFSPWWVYLRIPEITIPLLRLHEHVHAQSRLGERLTIDTAASSRLGGPEDRGRTWVIGQNQRITQFFRDPLCHVARHLTARPKCESWSACANAAVAKNQSRLPEPTAEFN
jgi:hypothetical protein